MMNELLTDKWMIEKVAFRILKTQEEYDNVVKFAKDGGASILWYRNYVDPNTMKPKRMFFLNTPQGIMEAYVVDSKLTENTIGY